MVVQAHPYEKNFRALSGDVDKWTRKYVTVQPWQGYSLDSSHTFLPNMEFIRIINPSDVYVAVCSIYKISEQLMHL